MDLWFCGGESLSHVIYDLRCALVINHRGFGTSHKTTGAFSSVDTAVNQSN